MASDFSLEEIKNEQVDLVSMIFWWSIVKSRLDEILVHVSLSFPCEWWFIFYAWQETVPIEEVFTQLKCTREGLTSEEGEKRLQIFGYNKLEEKKESKFLKFLGFMWNPLSWVMECAAIMAIVLANGGVMFKSCWIVVFNFVLFQAISSVYNSHFTVNAGQASGLARFRRDHRASYNQLNNQFHWRKQCRKRCSCPYGWSRT